VQDIFCQDYKRFFILLPLECRDYTASSRRYISIPPHKFGKWWDVVVFWAECGLIYCSCTCFETLLHIRLLLQEILNLFFPCSLTSSILCKSFKHQSPISRQAVQHMEIFPETRLRYLFETLSASLQIFCFSFCSESGFPTRIISVAYPTRIISVVYPTNNNHLVTPQSITH
jgi:hypothetical protein